VEDPIIPFGVCPAIDFQINLVLFGKRLENSAYVTTVHCHCLGFQAGRTVVSKMIDSFAKVLLGAREDVGDT
jgi:hypothetical protein